MRFGYLLASLILAITCYVHVVIGGKYAVGPLLSAQHITPASRWLNYYCWHIASVLLVFMSAGMAWAGFDRAAHSVAQLLTLLSAALSVLCVAVTLKAKIPPLRFAASYLFAFAATAGAVGWVGI